MKTPPENVKPRELSEEDKHILEWSKKRLQDQLNLNVQEMLNAYSEKEKKLCADKISDLQAAIQLLEVKFRELEENLDDKTNAWLYLAETNLGYASKISKLEKENGNWSAEVAILEHKLNELTRKLSVATDEVISMHLTVERLDSEKHQMSKNMTKAMTSIKRILHNTEYSRSKAATERDREVFEIVYGDASNARAALAELSADGEGL